MVAPQKVPRFLWTGFIFTCYFIPIFIVYLFGNKIDNFMSNNPAGIFLLPIYIFVALLGIPFTIINIYLFNNNMNNIYVYGGFIAYPIFGIILGYTASYLCRNKEKTLQNIIYATLLFFIFSLALEILIVLIGIPEGASLFPILLITTVPLVIFSLIFLIIKIRKIRKTNI